jgi:hypothetical protein
MDVALAGGMERLLLSLVLLFASTSTAWARPACSPGASFSITRDLTQAISSLEQPWPTALLSGSYPDKAYDGHLHNVGDETFHDFETLMAGEDPLRAIAERVAWRAPGAGDDLVVFINGLGQVQRDAGTRGRYYAEQLRLPWAQIHNGSFLKDQPWWPSVNGSLDWVDAAIHRLGLSDSPVIGRTAELVQHALASGQDLTLGGDSHGTIFLSRALRRAQHQWVDAHAAPWDLAGRARAEREFTSLAREHLRVITFGNGHRDWVLGPSYLHVYIDGDPLPSQFGTTQQGSPGPDHHFLVFDSVFPEGSFEAHNMKFSAALLAETFERNGLERGDLDGLFERARQGSLVPARPDQVDWPDMSPHQWDPGFDLPAALAAWEARQAAGG